MSAMHSLQMPNSALIIIVTTNTMMSIFTTTLLCIHPSIHSSDWPVLHRRPTGWCRVAMTTSPS